MIKIVVCVKQVIDPEAPVSSFRVDTDTNRVVPPKGTPPVLNPFDENALEAALKIKDAQSAEITVVSAGPSLAKAVLRKSLAAGADRLVLLEDSSYDDLDGYATACVLAEAIKRLGDFNLIVCGRQAADTDAGIVGSGIAEILGIPSITEARKITVNGNQVIAERILPDGYQVIQTTLPALITVSNEVGQLRSSPLPAVIASQKKEITVWNAQALRLEPSLLKRTKLLKLFQPVRGINKCEIVAGESPQVAGANLAEKLREAGLI